MLRSTRQFLDTLNEKGIKYSDLGTIESGKDVISVSSRATNMSLVTAKLIFGKGCEDVAVRIFDIVKVPEGREDRMLRAVNELNFRLRFAKFTMDMKDNTIQLEMDATFSTRDAGEISFELMARAIHVCNEAYAELNKALWS